MKKGFLATILVLCMVLGMLPPGMAWAADSDFTIENGVLTKYTGPGGDVTIPDSVTYIGDSAFMNCSSLTSVTIPDSVTGIGNDAFLCCNSLTNVIIPDSVTSIGYRAFDGCSSLTSITIPNSVTSIGILAFYGCGLSSITIPNSLTSIGDYVFEYCSSLSSITIPDSVTSIGSYAFYGCGLSSIIIPNSVIGIGDSAFGRCSNLTNITIPNSVTSIGNNAFEYCRSLSNITIPNSVISIGNHAFDRCGNLTSITISNSVTSIGDHAFWYCYGLSSITIPNSVTSIGNNAFEYCGNLSNITISNSVTSIGNNAFSRCGSLSSITIPNSVTSIGDGAFTECTRLSSIMIPNSVNSIGNGAFEYCTSLTDVYYTGNKSQWEAIEIGDYNDCLTAATIHYNSTGETSDPTAFVYISGGKYTDSNGYGATPTISSNGDTAYIPAGATGLILEFSIPATSDIIFSDENVMYDDGGCPNFDLIFDLIAADEDYGLSATEAYIDDMHKTLGLAFTGAAKPGQLDFTFSGFALANAPGQLATGKDGYFLTSNTIHLVIQGNDTPDTPAGTTTRVDFFPNNGTITSIRGYDRSTIYPGSDLAQEQDIFVDTYSGIGMIMSDKTGQLDCLPVIAREGYTFDGWWYTDNQNVINSAYDREITDFTGMRRVDLSTNFASLADSPESIRNVIAKWNKNSDETDNTHEVWFHLNGGTVTGIQGVTITKTEYGEMYDSDGNWIYAEREDDSPEILGVMVTDKLGKLAGLPVIEREGYTFDGWYTMENGGSRIPEDYTFTGAGQYGRDYLWAHWVPSTDQPGDLTGDNKVTMADVIRLARGAAGYVTLTEQERQAGDVNGDGKITMADVIRVARYAAGYSTSL